MMRLIALTCSLVAFAAAASARTEPNVTTSPDEPPLERALSALARQALAHQHDDDRDRALDTRFRLQLVAGTPRAALDSLRALRELRRPRDPVSADGDLVRFAIYADALAHSARNPVAGAYPRSFRQTLGALDDKAAYYVLYFLARLDARAVNQARDELTTALQTHPLASLAPSDSIDLLLKYEAYRMARATEPLVHALIDEDDRRRYLIDDRVLIKTPQGVTLSATLFRPRRLTGRAPTTLFYTIYPQGLHDSGREGAAHGYVTVVADARGKRLSPDTIEPYQHEVDDVNAVIDWIARQPWSDGRVGMWGNSYCGFAQWAATKRLHPALKTIVPSAAAIPGLGLPMENNVFINANYGWAFYVGDNQLLDDAVYDQGQRWRALNQRWYESGRPYREIDRVDGTPNPWLQTWLRHPSYDRFWQDMVPYGDDYAHIDIPILTISGYYDDGQISALHYLREHYRHNPDAQHYLLIGPYQHFSAQAAHKPAAVNGYAIDPVAQIDTKEIIFQWMDWVLRGAAKPPFLVDKINYEVMGANQWRHAPTLQRMANETLRLYLSDAAAGANHALTPQLPPRRAYLEQRVDLSDRQSDTDDYYYPAPIILDSLDLKSGFAFVSQPFEQPVSVDGMPSGQLRISVNKRDVDINVVFYELMPDGKLFHLTYYLGRASYAQDMTTRHLLTPNQITSIPFERTRLVSRQLGKGSRLMVVVNVNKNPFAQVNHGTGKDVSDESAADGREPLIVRWYNDSFVQVPITR